LAKRLFVDIALNYAYQLVIYDQMLQIIKTDD